LGSQRKNLLSSVEIDTECTWNGCDEESKILCAAWSESVIIIILAMSGILVA